MQANVSSRPNSANEGMRGARQRQPLFLVGWEGGVQGGEVQQRGPEVGHRKMTRLVEHPTIRSLVVAVRRQLRRGEEVGPLNERIWGLRGAA